MTTGFVLLCCALLDEYLGHSKLYPGFWSTARINFGKIHFLAIIFTAHAQIVAPQYAIQIDAKMAILR